MSGQSYSIRRVECYMIIIFLLFASINWLSFITINQHLHFFLHMPFILDRRSRKERFKSETSLWSSGGIASQINLIVNILFMTLSILSSMDFSYYLLCFIGLPSLVPTDMHVWRKTCDDLVTTCTYVYSLLWNLYEITILYHLCTNWLLICFIFGTWNYHH